MYSITKEGKIIEIPVDKLKKLEYYKEHFGVFETEKQAKYEKKRREKANRWLADSGYPKDEV